MYNYNKSVLSPYDPTKLAIHSILRPEDDLISNCGPTLKKTVSFDDVVHFIDEENMVTYVDFDYDVTFFPENPTKFRQINRGNRITFPDPVRNPNAFPATINISVLLMSRIALISFWTRTIYGTWFQQLLCHSATLMIHTLCSISTLNQQLNNLEQTHIRCSLHYERWTVKGRDCVSVLHSFKEITHRTDEWTKKLLRLKSWVISGSPEQWMELNFLWWSVIVSKCVAICFTCFISIVCWCNICCFFENLPFLFPFFDDFEWAVKIHWHFVCKSNIPLGNRSRNLC